MERDKRAKYCGIYFYIFLLSTILLSEKGSKTAVSFIESTNVNQALIAIIGLGLTFFSLEPIGYLFNSIHHFFWNFPKKIWYHFSGYAAEWSLMDIKINEKFYQLSNVDSIKRNQKEKYDPDVILSYFWQQANKFIVDWVSRRHTAFFTGMSIVVSIFCGCFLSIVLISTFQLGFVNSLAYVYIIAFILQIIHLISAYSARYEARNMISLWINSAFDDNTKNAISKINGLFCSSNTITKNKITSPYCILRNEDIKKIYKPNDIREYYFSEKVDIVSTTISKKHIEKSHYHSSNKESYFIIQGVLYIFINSQSFKLLKGDLITIEPNVCHHFETTDETVIFLAIKKEIGIDDKVPCE
jgi:quercetin dioxygenase-like cupin family protein